MGVTETQLAQFAKLGVSVKPDRRAFMRNLFGSVIERIILDPETGKFEIRYRLPITGVKVASPRGFEPRVAP